MTNIEAIAGENMKALSENSYPGRGIVVGRSDMGELMQVYWVMGRSEKSRNRKLKRSGNVIKTELIKDMGDEDTSLILYEAMRKVNGYHIVSNGSQTTEVAEAFRKSRSLPNLLEIMKFIKHEPDGPNFTPRITAITDETDGSAIISKISKDPLNPDDSIRNYYFRRILSPGFGMCIHTYEGDDNPLPSFVRDPYPVLLSGSVIDVAEKYWDLLDKDNRVALVVKGIGGSFEPRYKLLPA